MKGIFPQAVMAGLLTCGLSLAQNTTTTAPQNMPAQSPTTQSPAATQPGAPSTEPGGQPRIAPGSVIPVELTKTIDAKKAKSGDEVVAKVTQDMKTQTGQVLVPKDTKVIGHVTEAQPRHKDEKESQLAIAFNQAVLNNQQVQLPMSIQAVVGPEKPNDNSAAPAAGGSTAAPSPSSTGTGASSPMAGRAPNSGASQPQGAAGVPTGGGGDESQQQTAGNRPPINAHTQGVIGISNLSLSPNSNNQQGSVLTSDKNNVKLESGTMLLLRVNQ
jgi:hypothetical protein